MRAKVDTAEQDLPDVLERGRFRLGYRPSIDGLRAVAIIAVMAFHFDVPGSQGGFLGVDVFFVISGFLITTLLLEERSRVGSVNLRRFYARRALRLFPALVVLLGLYLADALLFAGGDARASQLEQIGAAFYMMNWALAFGWVETSDLAHTWSLAIEEQFYLLWPFALSGLMLLGGRRWRPLAIVGAAILASAAWRAVSYEPTGAEAFYRSFFGLDTRGDGLLMGCLVALVASFGLLPRLRWHRLVVRGCAMASIAVLAVLMIGPDNAQASYYEAVPFAAALAVAVLLVDLLIAPTSLFNRILSLRPLVWIGRISYSLYLWHVLAYQWVGGGRFTVAKTAAGVAVSFVLATASYYVVERRFLRLKARFAAEGRSDRTEARHGVETAEPAVAAIT